MHLEEVHKSLFIGDSKTYRLSVVDASGVAISLTGDSIVFTAKREATDLEAAAIIVKKSIAAGGSDAEIEILASPDDHMADVKLEPDDTSGQEASDLVFDIQITRTGSGKVHTIVKGTLTLEQDVTN